MGGQYSYVKGKNNTPVNPPDMHWALVLGVLLFETGLLSGLTEAVKPGGLVISDMWCEGGGGIWKGDGDFSFFDAPFIWCALAPRSICRPAEQLCIVF